MCDATGKTVRIYARNGNGIFYPASGMWFNNTDSNTTNDLSSTVFSIGSLDESKLIFDGSTFTEGNIFSCFIWNDNWLYTLYYFKFKAEK